MWSYTGDDERDGLKWLECQDCGQRIRELTKAEQRDVAYNPYNYVVYCYTCRAERQAERLIYD